MRNDFMLKKKLGDKKESQTLRGRLFICCDEIIVYPFVEGLQNVLTGVVRKLRIEQNGFDKELFQKLWQVEDIDNFRKKRY